MSDKKNIDRLFQEKFKDFEARPNDAVWEGIEARLQNKKKKRRVVPMWWRFAGVAAVLLLMFAIGNGVFNSDSDTILPVVVDTDKSKTDGIIDSNNELDSNQDNLILDSTTKNDNVVASQKDVQPTHTDAASTENNTHSSAAHSSTRNSGKNSIASSETKAVKQNSDILASNQKAKKTNYSEINSVLNTNKKDNIVLNSEEEKKDSKLKSTSEINPLLKSKKQENNTLAKSNTTTESSEKLEEEEKLIEIIKTEKTIEDAIAEANTLSEKEEEKDLSRWSIAPNVAPVYFNSLGEGSAIDPQFNNNITSSDITMSYGVKGSYAINKRLKVTTGVNRVNFNNTTSNVIGLSDNNFAARSTSNAAKLQNVTLNNNVNGASLTVMSKNSLLRSSVPEAINTIATGDLDQRFGFIEIPLELEYRVIDKKIGVNVSGGFSTLFLNENEIFADVNGESTLIGEANNLSDTSFTANIGLGIDYNISKKININLEPKFKYQLNTFNNTSGDFQPFFIGVYTGLNFKF